jgi:hypothetical protein
MRKIYADAGRVAHLGTATNPAVLIWHLRYGKAQNAILEDNKVGPSPFSNDTDFKMGSAQAFGPVTGVVNSASHV